MADYVEEWRRTIQGADKSWVVFRHGTCIVLADPGPADDLVAVAIAILREYGPVQVATPAGDFGVITLDPDPGFVVTGHHPDVLTFVGEDEVPDPNDLSVGLYGRAKRDQDAHDLDVIHVEDHRG